MLHLEPSNGDSAPTQPTHMSFGFRVSPAHTTTKTYCCKLPMQMVPIPSACICWNQKLVLNFGDLAFQTYLSEHYRNTNHMEQTIFVAGWDDAGGQALLSTLQALDAKTGEPRLWSTSVGFGNPAPLGQVQVWDTGDGRSVFIVRKGITALDTRSGEALWTDEVQIGSSFVGIEDPTGLVYVIDDEGTNADAFGDPVTVLMGGSNRVYCGRRCSFRCGVPQTTERPYEWNLTKVQSSMLRVHRKAQANQPGGLSWTRNRACRVGSRNNISNQSPHLIQTRTPLKKISLPMRHPLSRLWTREIESDAFR